MRFWRTCEFFIQLLSTSIKSSINVPGALLIESLLMIANNLIFFSIWWIFFLQFDDVGGWKIKDMMALMAIGTGAHGLMLICFGGVRHLSRMIVSGDLDPYMTQPKNLLIHLISSRSFVKGWGHLLTTLSLIILGNFFDLSSLTLILLSMVCGCLVFTSVGIIAHSMAFWLGSIENLSQKYCDSLFLFALYPSHIYSGFLNIIMFTLLPAGIIGYLPVELLRHFSWLKLIFLICSALSFWGLSFAFFYLGLRRYESGNQFSKRL